MPGFPRKEKAANLEYHAETLHTTSQSADGVVGLSKEALPSLTMQIEEKGEVLKLANGYPHQENHLAEMRCIKRML